MTIMDS